MDAGPQQFLGPANSVDRTAQLRSERCNVRGSTVGESVFCLGPDELIWIEFWSIGGKTMNLKSLMVANEISDDDAPVDCAAIPEKHHRATQVPQKVAQESDDLHACDVARVEAEIQSETFSGWGHGDAGDDGNPIPLIVLLENRSLPDGRPGFTDVRDEEEAALVEKDEMGPKFSGFFLNAAKCFSSRERWLSRPAAKPAAPASDRSIPSPASPATRGLDGSVSRNVSRSTWICAEGSRGPSYILRTGNPLSATARVGASVVAPAAADVQEQVWVATLSIHPCDEPAPSVPPNLLRNSGSRLLIDRSCRTEAGRWPALFASVVARGIQGVSLPIW